MTIQELLAARRLDRMVALRAEVPLNQADGMLVDRAIKRVRSRLRAQQKELYDAAVIKRDEQHEDLIGRIIFAEYDKDDNKGPSLLKQLAALKADVEGGLITAADARARLRDYRATHQQMIGVHKGLIDADDALAAADAQSPEDFQAQTAGARADRFTLVPSLAGPTLGDVIAEIQAEG